jgi:ribosomal-protein-alanine N-acetyltransferase
MPNGIIAKMAAPAVLSLRPATEEDRSRLANLLHFETHVHRHLDWRRPLDWLGTVPFFVTETDGRLTAALACPPDPPGVAWVRLFAAITRLEPAKAWSTLWPVALEQLEQLAAHQAAAIPLEDWFRRLLAKSHFENTHNVVVLEWKPDGDVPQIGPAAQASIRLMREGDLPSVYRVDAAAFAPLWQNSQDALGLAFKQAGLATLIEDQGEVVAYQISTQSSQGLHLARLATHPKMQGRGLALDLVLDLQKKLIQRSGSLLSVNTQDNNMPSLSLYKKLGFKLNGERFPVFQFPLN